MDMQELVTNRDAALANAKAALARDGGPDLDTAVNQRKLAEGYQKAINEFSALGAIVPLPGAGNGVMVPAAKQSPNTQSNGDTAGAYGQAAYTTKFREPEAAVQGVLKALYGENPQEAYLLQWSAFKRYLRYGEAKLQPNERASLEQVVFTPGLVKAALDQGVDAIDVYKATMVDAVSSLGGFVAPVDFQSRIIERVKGMTIMRGRASADSTSRDMVEIPVSTGGDDQYSSAVRVTWVDETPTAGQADTNLRFGLESIPIHTVMAEAGLSRNVAEDASFNIESYLVRKLGEAAAIDEDNKFLVGSGVGTPQGILPGSTNALSLTEKVSGSSSALTWAGLIGLSYAIPSQYRQNAVWIAERATYEAIAKLTASGGEFLWNPYQFVGGAEWQPPKLLGFPVLEQESMPSIASSAYPLVFGDLTGYQIFDRVGMTIERFLDSGTARQNMIIYVMRRRLGGQVVEPWRFAVQKIST